MEINADMKCFRSTDEWRNNLQVEINVSMTFYWQSSSKNSVSLRIIKFEYFYLTTSYWTYPFYTRIYIKKDSNFLDLLYNYNNA